MTYGEYIAYHLRGDAGVEERTIAALCRQLRLSKWGAFELVYYYAMTYHIPSALLKVRSTSEAYQLVSSWYYFGRYAAYLFLEVWMNVCSPGWKDDLKPGWEPDENYTKGAQILAGSNDPAALDAFLDRVRKDTGDNVFAIETSLCAVAKFEKGTRYDGYYTERMLSDATGTRWHHLIYSLAS